MKLLKLSLAAAIAVTVACAQESDSEIGLSANVALTSNYIWRGMTQTKNSPALQGGFDVDYKGIYAGVWGSNVNFGGDASVEIDIYAGYANEIAGISYDIGYAQYTYPNESDELNFGEVALSLGYDFEVVSISAKYYIGVDTNNVANDAVDGWEPGNGWEVGASVPIPMEISIDGTYGSYNDSGTQNNHTNNFGKYYSIGATKAFGKFEITVAYTGMDYAANDGGYDGNGKENNLVATLGASF
jgi:uncharacterized protein (TIGR02001 family)